MTDLTIVARDKGIKYFQVSFVDLFGVMRAKLVPAEAMSDMQGEGAGFAGFASWLDMTPAHPDMFARPDPASLIQLPWKPEVGWLAADLWMDGGEVAQAPRNTLKRVIADAKAKGMRPKTGVEAEYFLITPEGDAISDPADVQTKPCYDIQALMRRYDVIREICDAMQTLGWGPYQNDHEDANGQFEMNWEYDDALVTADRHAFFKYMVKSIAEIHGMRATFMPKPFAHLTGNGLHCHVSVWDEAGETNLFHDDAGELGTELLGEPSSVRRGPDDALYVTTYSPSGVTRLFGGEATTFFTDSYLEEPVELAFRGEELFVLGNDTGNVVVADGTGQMQRELGYPEMRNAHDMAFGPDGLLYVATSFSVALEGGVQRWDVDSGELVGVLASEGEVGRATGLAFDDEGWLYVADSMRGTVVRFAAESGTMDRVVVDGLEQPVSLAVAAGELYVADRAGVHRFDADGGERLGDVLASDEVERVRGVSLATATSGR